MSIESNQTDGLISATKFVKSQNPDV